MKMTQFRQMIREIIDEALELESQAGEEAKRQGLERKPGFGNYGPPGKDLVTHTSRGGKLVAKQKPTKTDNPDQTKGYGYAFGDPDKIRDIDLLEKRNKN